MTKCAKVDAIHGQNTDAGASLKSFVHIAQMQTLYFGSAAVGVHSEVARVHSKDSVAEFD